MDIRSLARLDVLDATERRRLEAPDGAAYNINLARSGVDGSLPMRRIFQDEHGNKLAERDLSNAASLSVPNEPS